MAANEIDEAVDVRPGAGVHTLERTQQLLPFLRLNVGWCTYAPTHQVTNVDGNAKIKYTTQSMGEKK